MVSVVFPVGAIAGAAAAKRSSMDDNIVYIRREPERIPNDVGGMIFITDGLDVSVSQNPFEMGVYVRFRGSAAVSRLIEDLTKLRDDMIKKENGIL